MSCLSRRRPVRRVRAPNANLALGFSFFWDTRSAQVEELFWLRLRFVRHVGC
ncbi:hypothetical protein WN48_09876 [Eufriesea mexicana]|nr:hypothetical protein WN48_09876 [Eufriesea mexicana]